MPYHVLAGRHRVASFMAEARPGVFGAGVQSMQYTFGSSVRLLVSGPTYNMCIFVCIYIIYMYKHIHVNTFMFT